MKMILAIAAVMAAAASAPASAAPQERVVVRERTTSVTRHYRPGNRWRTRTVCNWRWRNHRRVRVCRTVRHRY